MRIATVVVMSVLLFLPCVYAADSGEVAATQNPSVTQVTGNIADAKLGPALYPQFTDFEDSTDAQCQSYLEKDFASGGFSLAPICQKSKFGNGAVAGECLNDFVPIDELVVKNFKIPSAYRNTAKLLVTWTVRIEGYSKSYSINPELCTKWYGTVTEKFPEGIAKTALYVNGIKMGNEVTMEIPAVESRIVKELPPPPPVTVTGGGDPTLVGSYVLTAADFPEGKFPETIELIEIRWKNETSMDLVSPKGMRNMIINMLPITNKN